MSSPLPLSSSSDPPPQVNSSSLTLRKVNKRTCTVVGCKNGIVQGGVCIAHGAKRRKCRFPGCDKNSKCAGLCSRHGPPRKKCDAEGCNNVSVQAGKCKSHLLQPVKCKVSGCSSSVVVSVYGEDCCNQHLSYKPLEGTESEPKKPELESASTMPEHPVASGSGAQDSGSLYLFSAAQNRELLQRVVGQNSMSAIMMCNMAMTNPYCGYPITPGGLAAYAMSTNPMACNPMMAAAMNIGMIDTNSRPDFGTSLGYGSQMMPSSEFFGSGSLDGGLGFCGGMGNIMNNQPGESIMTDKIDKAPALPSFDVLKGKVDGGEEEEEDPHPW